jgi:hypothetical protein
MIDTIPVSFTANQPASGQEPWFVSDAVSEHCSTHLYLDATLSMQGFVNHTAPASYEQVLQKLSQISYIVYKNHDFSYYRFWENPEPLSQAQFREDAFKKPFYQMNQAPQGNDARQTNLVNVLEGIAEAYTLLSPDEQQDRVSIVVSDMVSTSQSDRDDVVQALNQSFLRQGLSVGLIGIQSAFNGKVFDLVAGGATYSFQYDGPRPFYLLLIGTRANLQVFLDECAQTLGTELTDDYQSLLITSQLLRGDEQSRPAQSLWQEEYRPFVLPAQAEQMFIGGSAAVARQNQIDTVAFFHDLIIELPQMSTPRASLQLNNPIGAEQDAIIALNQWQLAAQTFMIEGVAVDDLTGLPLSQATESQQVVKDPALLTLSDLRMDAQHEIIQWAVQFDMNKMIKDRMYLIQIDITGQPVVRIQDPPNWLSEWTMDFAQLSQWLADKKTFDGRTTPYLSDIFTTLWRKAAADAQVIPSFYLGSYRICVISSKPADGAIDNECLDRIDVIKRTLSTK